MGLRRSLLLGFCVGFIAVASLAGPASAQAGSQADAPALPLAKYRTIWPTLDDSQRMMVDLVAADFFENEFSQSQRERLYSARAQEYLAADAAGREALRNKARNEWQGRTATETGTGFDRLGESQKALFRRYAIDQLGLGKPAPVTPGAAGRNEV